MSDSNIAPRSTDMDFDPFAGPSIARVVPTTEAQREIWLASKLGVEASLAYNESVSLAIKGRLNLSAYQSALNAVLRRHDSLRSTLSADGMSLLVSDEAVVEVKVRDFTALAAIEQEVVVVAFWRHTLLPLDDYLHALQPTIPQMTRSYLHRCLQRHGMSRLPDVDGDKPSKQKF